MMLILWLILMQVPHAPRAVTSVKMTSTKVTEPVGPGLQADFPLLRGMTNPTEQWVMAGWEVLVTTTTSSQTLSFTMNEFPGENAGKAEFRFSPSVYSTVNVPYTLSLRYVIWKSDPTHPETPIIVSYMPWVAAAQRVILNPDGTFTITP